MILTAVSVLRCARGSEEAGTSVAEPDTAALEESAMQALDAYVKKPDSEFRWQVEGNRSLPDGTQLTDLKVTSQKWQGITWEHSVGVFEPQKLKHPKHAIVFVSGGRLPTHPVGGGDLVMGVNLARSSGMRVIVLRQVPNQPLLGRLTEDALISESWVRYLASGDENWPLLFPMVKSVVRTMDAVSELTGGDADSQVSSFVITGASKRGWTSWLVPATDSRVIATAPIVIDMLNFRAQAPHQLKRWGRFSEQIRDYTSRNLIVIGNESPREQRLRLMMDPYTYRSRLSLPKFLVNGANDPYWVVDAMQFYWDDLVGPRSALFIPNAGHNLGGGQLKALQSVGVFAQRTASSRSMPAVTWSINRASEPPVLTVSCNEKPIAVRVWTTRSADSDFRNESWAESDMQPAGNDWTSPVLQRGSSESAAAFAELQFREGEVPFSVCTLVVTDVSVDE